MRKKIKSVFKATAFILIFVLLLSLTGNIFQPVWLSWNNYYTQHGFYEEKENTIETIFLGPSTMLTDIIPIQLYEDYGICAYNLCTEQQPVLASYIWAKEAYHYHSESLKTIVFCVSELRDTSSASIYHKALDNLKPSLRKFTAFTLFNKGNPFAALSDMFPLFNYHHRWEEMTAEDILSLGTDPVNGTRGYCFDSNIWGLEHERKNLKNIMLDESAEPQEMVESSMLFFEFLVNFCEKNGLKLVLTKAPAKNWNSALHNATELIAQEHGLEFYDFNYSPLYDSLNTVDVFDSTDGGTHMNYFGATKITDWFGKYLTEECDATDVRSNPDFAFMDSQLERFNSVYRKQIELIEATDVAECLSLAINKDTTVFIMLNDTVTQNLTDEQRKYFASAGLSKLSGINEGDSYLAVIEGGKVTYEKQKDFGYTKNYYSLTYTEETADGKKFTIESGGANQGKIASCIIDNEEYAVNDRGINLVVYNHTYGEYMYSACFDTHEEGTRDSYNRDFGEYVKDEEAREEYKDNEVFQKVLERYEATEKLRQDKEDSLSAKNNYFFSYLEKYLADENNIILLAGTGELTKALTKENLSLLEEYGLEKLSEAKEDFNYIALIDNKGVHREKISAANEALAYSDGIFSAECSENDCSVKINGKEYASDTAGLHAIIFDREENGLLTAATFDTVNKPIKEAVW